MKKICLLILFTIVVLNFNVHAMDYNDFLVPLPENPSLVGYSTELKESMLSLIEGSNGSKGFFGVDVSISPDPYATIFGLGLGIPINFNKFSFYIPLFFGAVGGFSNDLIGNVSIEEVTKYLLIENAMELLPPQGIFLSGGLFISSRYFHLGFMYDTFIVDDNNRFLGGTYSSMKIFPRFYFKEIPYIGIILDTLDAFFSLEQLFESLSTETSLNTFTEEYGANMLFNKIPIGSAAITLIAYTHMKWYDVYSKVDMQGAKLFLSFNTKGNNFFIFFSDVAYRRYFDVIMAPEYSNYYNGLYLKTGFLFINKSKYSPSFFQMYIESGREPLFKTPKIGLLFGIKYNDTFSWKTSSGYAFSSNAGLPINFAFNARYLW